EKLTHGVVLPVRTRSIARLIAEPVDASGHDTPKKDGTSRPAASRSRLSIRSRVDGRAEQRSVGVRMLTRFCRERQWEAFVNETK
ncbi:MAG: hypothetical protein ACREPF_01085, partial [Rhodanobacteraceae bacterium]